MCRLATIPLVTDKRADRQTGDSNANNRPYSVPVRSAKNSVSYVDHRAIVVRWHLIDYLRAVFGRGRAEREQRRRGCVE